MSFSFDNSYTLAISNGHWIVTDGHGTVTLTGETSVVIGSQTYDLVDHLGAGTGGYQSLQAAVDAAHSGDIIMVGAATYTEQVVIDPAHGHGVDNITIQGMAGATLQAPAQLEQTGISPSNARSIDGLITVNAATGVSIKGLTVDGLHHGDSFDNATPQNDPELVGIAFLNSTGGSIDGVTVTGMRESDSGIGDQRNLGIYVSNTDPTPGSVPTAGDVTNHTLNTISITNSTITDFQKGGIVATNADVTITGNIVTGVGPVNTSQNGIQVSGSTGEVSDNTISNIANTSAPPNDTAATGVLAYFNNNLVIDHNTFTGAEVAGQVVDTTVGVYVLDSDNGQITNNVSHNADDGVVVQSQFGVGMSGDWTVSGNTADGVPADGAALYFDPNPADPASHFTVTGSDSASQMVLSPASDHFTGGAGNDVFIVENASDLSSNAAIDSVDGGGGTGDSIVFASDRGPNLGGRRQRHACRRGRYRRPEYVAIERHAGGERRCLGGSERTHHRRQ